jgi:hypothetical protein
MTELKPCWICQSPAELDYHCGTRYVECTNEDCGNQGPLDWNDEGAISAWNREAETNLIPRPAGEVGELVERLLGPEGDLCAALSSQAAARITALSAEVAAYERSIVLKQELIEALSAEVERWKGFAARAARQMDDMAGDTGNESPDLSDEIQAALGAKP